MAVKYLRSAAAGAGTGADWTNAYTTLVLAFAGAAAGDTIYVADDHAETQASTMTLTSPGTAGNLVRVVCVNTHVTVPPTATATSATISTTGAFQVIFAAGYAYVYGITFNCASAAASLGTKIASASANQWIYDTCVFANLSTSAGPMQIGQSGFVSYERVEFRNTNVGFNATGSLLAVTGKFEWRGGTLINSGQIPTVLISPNLAIPGAVEISGVDLSIMGSGKSLVNGANTNPCDVFFRNCKLGASVGVLTGTIGGQGGVRAFLDNCDSGNTNYRMEHYRYQGSIKQELTKVRASGGATDGATTISHNFTTLATGPTLFSPLEGPWMREWNETTGSAITITVETCTENVTLTNAEAYLEVEYLGTSGFPQSIYLLSRAVDIFATPANLTTSAVSWNGFSTAAPQSIALTFTPQVKGQIRARICLVKASTSLYVDPQITVTSGPTISRSYLDPDIGYMNETAAATGGGLLTNPGMTGGMRG